MQTYTSFISPVLVGRTREIEFLGQALQAAQNGAGCCILFSGEAGIGKSRLAAELTGRAAAQRFLILQGYCSEQDISFPYSLWITALRAFLARYNPAETSELLGTFAPELVKLLPELSLLIPSIRPSSLLDPEAEKHRLFESLIRFAASLTTAQPLLVVLEDLHWSDEQSLDLLNIFVRRIASLPIMVLVTYRAEDSSPRLTYHLSELNRAHLAQEIQLAPLARSDVSQMVQAITRSEQPITAGWLDLLMRLTEGNPFFVEEMTKNLVQEGFQSGQIDRIHIPRSIKFIVQRRAEKLPIKAQRILSLISVIGDRFDFSLLREISDENELDLLGILNELISTQMIIEQSADQYLFRHALTREAVYATLSHHERKSMHQMIGEKIERMTNAQAEPPAASLAYHFYQAEDWQKALEYSQQAGEKAQAQYAPREALTHFAHAVTAAQQLAIFPPYACLHGRAQANKILGNFEAALTDYETIFELSRQNEDRHIEWQAGLDLGLLWQSRDLERAGKYYRHVLDLARRLDDVSALAQSMNRIGNWYMNRGQVRQALLYHRRALKIFQDENDRHGMASTMDHLGIVSNHLGEVIQGSAYLEQAISIFRELDDRQGLVNSLTNITFRVRRETEVLGGTDFKQLALVSDEARQIAHEMNWFQGEVQALIQEATCLELAGEYGQALDRIAAAQTIVEETQDRESFARIHLVLGQIYIALLALAEGRQHLEIGLSVTQELGSGLLTLGAKTHLASDALLNKDLPRAHSFLDGLIVGKYPKKQELVPQRMCWAVRAELELLEGYPDRALEIINRLLASTSNLDQYGPQAVPLLSRLRAQALVVLGQAEQAITELHGTLLVAQQQGQHPLLWRLHSDLGKAYSSIGRREESEREFSSTQLIINNLAKNVPEATMRDNFMHQALATIPAEHVPTLRQLAKKEFGGLTLREREIAALIAHGKSNREIADELFISEKTAERHVANIMAKLSFNARAQIATWVVTKGLYK